MRKSAQEKFKRADTLMGILKDAGVDPPKAPDTKRAQNDHRTSTTFHGMARNEGRPDRRGSAQGVWTFVKNGFRS